LETLDLANNKIKEIDSIAATAPVLATLKVLNLESNQIKLAQLPAFQSLTFISFKQNQIRGLFASNFAAINPSQLEQLDLGYNEISSIDSNTFSRFAALKQLDLTGNRLARIEPDLLSGICLESVMIARNPVSLYTSSTRDKDGCVRLQVCGMERKPMNFMSRQKTLIYA